MTDIPPIKIKNGQVKLPEEIMDLLFLNEGDYVLFTIENNRVYLRKTRKQAGSTEETTINDKAPPPPTIEEQASNINDTPKIENDPTNFMNAVQDALKDPNIMKMVQDMAKQFSGAFGDLGKMMNNMGTMKNPIDDEDEEDEEDEEEEKREYDTDNRTEDRSEDKDKNAGMKKNKEKSKKDDDEDDNGDEGYRIPIKWFFYIGIVRKSKCLSTGMNGKGKKKKPVVSWFRRIVVVKDIKNLSMLG